MSVNSTGSDKTKMFFHTVDKPESKSQVQAQIQIEKGKEEGPNAGLTCRQGHGGIVHHYVVLGQYVRRTLMML